MLYRYEKQSHRITTGWAKGSHIDWEWAGLDWEEALELRPEW